MLIVFRGTETPKEWAEIATVFMEQLDGDAKTSPFDIGFGRSVRLEAECVQSRAFDL